jgi:hypothetical protein
MIKNGDGHELTGRVLLVKLEYFGFLSLGYMISIMEWSYYLVHTSPVIHSYEFNRRCKLTSRDIGSRRTANDGRHPSKIEAVCPSNPTLNQKLNRFISLDELNYCCVEAHIDNR